MTANKSMIKNKTNGGERPTNRHSAKKERELECRKTNMNSNDDVIDHKKCIENKKNNKKHSRIDMETDIQQDFIPSRYSAPKRMRPNTGRYPTSVKSCISTSVKTPDKEKYLSKANSAADKSSRRRRVVFSPTCKAHDGLQPAHHLLDFFAWTFFAQATHPLSPLEIFRMAWRQGHAGQLSAVYHLLIDLEQRICELGDTEDVPVLPGGGGRLIQLNSSHIGLVRLLAELVSASAEMANNIQLHGGSGALDAPFDTSSSASSRETTPTMTLSSSSSAEEDDSSKDELDFDGLSEFARRTRRSVPFGSTPMVSSRRRSIEIDGSDESARRVFSLPAVGCDSNEDDDEEEDDNDGGVRYYSESESGGHNKTDVVVDGVPLTRKDIERMEERLAQIEDEHDGGDMNEEQYEQAKRYLSRVLDAVRCASS